MAFSYLKCAILRNGIIVINICFTSFFQLTSQKDYAIHLAKTPPKDADTTTQSKDTKKSKKHTTLDTVDEQWVATHANQVGSCK